MDDRRDGMRLSFSNWRAVQFTTVQLTTSYKQHYFSINQKGDGGSIRGSVFR
jgi:hypothetical protein